MCTADMLILVSKYLGEKAVLILVWVGVGHCDSKTNSAQLGKASPLELSLAIQFLFNVSEKAKCQNLLNWLEVYTAYVVNHSFKRMGSMNIEA